MILIEDNIIFSLEEEAPPSITGTGAQRGEHSKSHTKLRCYTTMDQAQLSLRLP